MAVPPETDQKAPDVTLTATVSERKVTPDAGKPQVWVFHGPKTTDAPKDVGKAVRARYEDASKVQVANVVDLRSMAGMWQKVAKAGLKQNYERMAKKLEAKDMDPEEFVILCPDWEGKAATAFGFEDPNTTPAIVVLAGDGTVVAAAEGGDLAEQALSGLQGLA